MDPTRWAVDQHVFHRYSFGMALSKCDKASWPFSLEIFDQKSVIASHPLSVDYSFGMDYLHVMDCR